TLVSHTSILTSTANGTSDGSAVSRDGSTVAFRSSAPDLGSGFTDTNASTDIFVWTRSSGAIALASHVAGNPTKTGNGLSDQAVIGLDGKYVAFQSAASNLVAGDQNGVKDAFLFSTGCAATVLSAVPNGNNRIDLAWTAPGSYTYDVLRSRT